jgi:hypothetical protein
MNTFQKITYEQILSIKNNITSDEEILKILKIVYENIKNINTNSFTTVKTKIYINNNISIDKQLISLLNLLTDINKIEICQKIINISFTKSDLDLIVKSIHKKFCLEYHFFNIYIYIIKQMILTGSYNFNNKLLWDSLINKIQTVFNSLDEISENEINIDYYCGNLIFIFYLCKEKLLSLKVISMIFEDFSKHIENKPILINILFKTVEHIPLDYKYNLILVEKIQSLLKKNIPFRLQFKLEELLNLILLEINKDGYKNKKIQKSKKSLKNIEFEKQVISFIKDYTTNTSLKILENKISQISNFRKSYFFKLFVLNIIKLDLSEQHFKNLLNFIYFKKYRPGNYKNILSQIFKIIKKTNNSKMIEKFNLLQSSTTNTPS